MNMKSILMKTKFNNLFQPGQKVVSSKALESFIQPLVMLL